MAARTPIITPIATWNPSRPAKAVLGFLDRPSFEPQAEQVAAEVLSAIRAEGDAAVARFVARFERCPLEPSQFRVTPAEIAEATRQVDPAFKRAAREADRRIARFSKAGMRKDWTMPTPRGGILGEQFRPIDRVGAYIPSGAAPLVSTALMTVTLARVAGVREIVACSPAGPDGRIDPYTLFALNLAGATEIYKLGGIQAIGAMAYGTATIAKVDKIVGPGGPYVTAAKRQVYGVVDLDLVAGPSEVAVLADDSADPAHIAIDLLSQAEHGTGSEKVLFVTDSAALAREVKSELARQLSTLSRSEAALRVLNQGSLIVVARNLDEGMDLCNRFAPEHFELLVRSPRRWLKKVVHAGAVFLGPWTPEVAGDFAAGPSHVLPTGGAARMFSGLTVDAFRKRTSIIELTRRDLQEVRPVIAAFSRVEGLDAHGRSAEIRFQKKAGGGGRA